MNVRLNHKSHPEGWLLVNVCIRLATQTEALDELTVASDVDIGQVAEKTATLTNEQQQSTT